MKSLIGLLLISIFVFLVPVYSKTRKEFHDEQNLGFVEMPTTEWPQAAGKNAEEVVAEIKQQNPALNVVKVPHGSPVTMDFRTDRVRVFFDQDGNVVGQPKIG